jgi:hypothetical protein
MSQPRTTVTIEPAEFERMLRRIVREELAAALRPPSILGDWSREGPDDPAQDELLLQEAMARYQKYRDRPQDLMRLEDFKRELVEADRAGELPD